MATNTPERYVSRLTQNTLALILAGGRGSRLKQLTKWRTKPAVPFGGNFRIIDFPLSNCINSGIRRIAVLTQYKSHSLIRHIQQGWSFQRPELGEFVELVPAQQRVKDGWYEGTADAVFQNLDIIRSINPEYILVLAGDHIYKMDYGPMLAAHQEKKADMTVGCVEVPLEQAKAFGVMSINDDSRIVEFNEKPDHPEPLSNKKDHALASMGIYIFNAKFLFEQLGKDAQTQGSSHDFGKDMIPSVIEKYRTYAYAYRDESGEQPYWRDVGTIDSYWAANMELIGITPELNLYDKAWPIWTHQPQLPPAKFIFDDEGRRGMAIDSMVSSGCLISGAEVHHSLLFSNVRINSFTTLNDCVILPDVTIGRNCRLNKVIIDKSCDIPEGTVIGENPEEDAKRFHVSDGGVVLVTPEMLETDTYHAR